MSYPVHDAVPLGDVLPVFFDSFDGGTGASITMTGLAVTDIEIYKDGSATTRASDNGYTLLDTDGIDFDSKTGIHGFSIDTGDDSDSGFYAVGSWFHVVISAITIDSQTVNFVAAAFRVVPAEVAAGVPDVNIASTDDIDFSDTQIATINTQADTALTDYAGPTKTEMDTAHALLATVADLLDKVGAVDEAAAAGDPSATESVMQYCKQIINTLEGAAGIVAWPAAAAPGNGVSMAEALRAAYDDTDNINTQVGTAGAGLGDLGGMSTAMKAEVNVEAKDVLVTDTYAEPAQGQPGDTISIEEKISFIYAALVNKVDVDSTLKEFYNAAGTVIWKKTVADDGSNYNEAKGAAGP